MRSKPSFKPKLARSQNNESDSLGCLWMIVVTVGGYYVFMAIDRVLSGHGNRLDHMICYGVLIALVILVVLAILQEAQDQIKRKEAQEEWKFTCKSVEVAIVNRQYYPGGSWEDEYGYHWSHSSYHLKLELTAEQRILFPNLQSVSVTVDENIYSELLDRNVVRVYYRPDSPMTFLLEEEME